MFQPSRLLALLVVVLAACDGAPPPQITLSPPPGPFNDTVKVTLTSDRPAKIFVTTDGVDPHLESKTRLSGDSPFTVELKKTATIQFFASADGAEGPAGTATYIRAGGKKGSVSGVVVVGSLAVGHTLAVLLDGQTRELGAPDKAGEYPFAFEDVPSGQHRVVAMSDRNDDGLFVPVLDVASEAVNFPIDLGDPFRASVEKVRLYIGASSEGLCTIAGTVTVPKPQIGQNVSVSALSPDAFGQNADPAALLAQLQNGYQVFAMPDQTQYPYAITNLQPGTYFAVPVLTSVGLSGAGLNFLANPLRGMTLAAGQTGKADFSFGAVTVSGAVTLKRTVPPGEQPPRFTYGVVAARHTSLSSGIQAVLMPVVFLPTETEGELKGTYAGSGLKESASFDLRVFASTDEQNPLLGAMTWVINPFAQEQPHATIQTARDDLTKDFSITAP